MNKIKQRIDRQAIISQQISKSDLLKLKLDSTSEDKMNQSLSILKQIKNTSAQGRYQLNKQNSQNNIEKSIDLQNSLKIKQDSFKRYPLQEHQKKIIEAKQIGLLNEKQDHQANNKLIIKQEYQKVMKTSQDQVQKNENMQTDQLVYSIDRGFSLKTFKNKFEFQKNRKDQNQNDRGLSLQDQRPQLNKIFHVKVSQSPNSSSNIENKFKIPEQTRLTSIQPNQFQTNNNIFNKPQSLLSTIYFNWNPYQLNQKSCFLDSNKVSTKNSTSAQIIVNSNDKSVTQYRVSRKNLTDIQSQNDKDQSKNQENLSLYLLYREQQQEQDKKLRELSNQKSYRNSQLLSCKYSAKDLLEEENLQISESGCKKIHLSNNNNSSIKIMQNKSNQEITQGQEKNIQKKKKLFNSTTQNSKTQEDFQDFCYYDCNEKSLDQLKSQRSRSLQTIKPNKNYKNIKIENEQSSQDDSEDLKQKDYQLSLQKINKSIDEDDEEEEEILYPSSQAKIQPKKTTQNAIMQTTFTEQIPEIVARELENINRNNQIQNAQKNINNLIHSKKKERLISYLSVNHKDFLSSTSYYIKKYEYDQNTNTNQNDTKNLKNSQSHNQFEKVSHQNIYSSTKCLTQECREANNFEHEQLQGQDLQKEVQLSITLHTSKEEFLSQLNKKIQKFQSYLNMVERKKLQDSNNLQYRQTTELTNLSSTEELIQTIQPPQNFQINKRLVFQVESDDVLKKIKENNNPQLYELLKSYQVNGCLYPINNNKEYEQISIYPLADSAQGQKTLNKFNNSKGKIICNIIVKKQRNKTSHHFDINNILQQSSNAYKSQLLSQSLLNK